MKSGQGMEGKGGGFSLQDIRYSGLHRIAIICPLSKHIYQPFFANSNVKRVHIGLAYLCGLHSSNNPEWQTEEDRYN